jgi:hypothetical protein
MSLPLIWDPLNGPVLANVAAAAYGVPPPPACGVRPRPAACPPPAGGQGGSSAAQEGGSADWETCAQVDIFLDDCSYNISGNFHKKPCVLMLINIR